MNEERKDENLLGKKFEELKEAEKVRIKEIQTLSIEELTNAKKLALIKECENEIACYFEENGQKSETMLKLFQDLKKYVLKISKKNIIVSKEEELDFLDGFSISDVLTLTPEELVDRKIEKIKQERDQKISDLIESTKTEKEKYSGITEDELDEYAGLLAKKIILNERIQLRKEEEELKRSKGGDSDSEFILSFDESSFDITNVEDIPHYLETIKVARKKELSRFLKFISAFGITFGTIAGTGLFAATDPLFGIFFGMAGGVSFIGLTLAIYGTKVLKGILQNKKFVERLKETGIYDMLVEKAGLEKEVEEFETSKGMR